jgi:hemerythrin-like domain-containing protein
MTTTQTGRLLDEEHRRNLAVLERMERAIAGAPAATPELALLVGEFAHVMEVDIGRHFDFEEQQLFTRLDDAGDGAIVALMREEHDAIREVASELLPLAREVAEGIVDEESWDRLRIGTLELIERQVSHIQKETLALLPLLEDLLDAQLDGELSLEYAATA